MAETTIQASLVAIVERLVSEIADDLKEELKRQGHRLTGRLIDSIEFRVTADPFGYTGQILFLEYGAVLETGVKPNRIPFSGRGRGGTSKYIQALIKYFQKRGLPVKRAKSAAFATAHVQKREGMPTVNSRRFSKNQKRTGFLSTVVEKSQPRLQVVFEQEAEKVFSVRLLNLAKQLSA